VEQSGVREDVEVAEIHRYFAAWKPSMCERGIRHRRKEDELLPLIARQVPLRLYEGDQQVFLLWSEQHAVKH
jgi:hypothetical protein